MRMNLENKTATTIQNKNPKSLFKNQLLVTCIFILAIVLITISGSFAIFSKIASGDEYNVVQVGELELSYVDLSDEGNVLNLASNYPTTDESGSTAVPYRFSVENTGTLKATYTVRIIDDIDTIKVDGCTENLIDTTYLRYKFDNQDPSTMNDIKDLEKDGYIVYTGTLEPFESNIHEIRLWINEKSPNSMLGKHYHGKVVIEMVQATGNNASDRPVYKEQILNGADPILGDSLVPITIANDGNVTRANTNEEWYNYAKKEWANAVILEETAKEYKTGEMISSDDIESYFVWVPRYKYKIFNDGNYTGVTSLNADAPQTIEIEFETKDTPVSSGTKKDEWLSHPAFQAFNTNGFWVGKFETGYKGATSPTEALVNSSDSTKIIVRPKEFSWRNITVGNAFKASYEYLRESESHMMKNTEWGAVAYLQHSIYGSRESIRVNNNNSYKTGYAAVEEPTLGYSASSIPGNLYGTEESITLPYNTSTGYTASTTGNISGIYDMSGGSHEYVMGYNQDASSVEENSEITEIYENFFTNSNWDKYYDKYTSASDNAYNNRILGDATGEMGPFGSSKDPDEQTRYIGSWYGDYSYFTVPSRPWIHRGGHWYNGTEAGIFYFGRTAGEIYKGISFRIVLAP